MKKCIKYLLCLSLTILAGCSGDNLTPEPKPQPKEPVVEPETPPGKDEGSVYGFVTCDGKGIADVVVSDGIEVSLTDADGYYSLQSQKKFGYVFISIPSGYEAPRDGILPRFYAYLESDKPERKDFELKAVDQSRYTMLYFGDMHLADRFDDFKQFGKFTSEVAGMVDSSDVPVYAMTLGDMSWDIFWVSHSYNLRNYLSTMDTAFGTSLPVFHTIGNHDHEMGLDGDFNTSVAFRKVLGPNYYSFNVGGVHYIVLDDINCHNTSGGERSFTDDITSEQLSWLRKDLAYVNHSTPVVVTVHAPLYYNSGSFSVNNGWDAVKCFSGFDNVHFVSGHTHILYNVDRLSSSIHVYENNSGAVCGAWWMTGSNRGISLSGDGAPSGYRVMNVSNGKADWQFKGTGLPSECQFRAYDRNRLQLSAEKWVPHATEKGRRLFLETVGKYAEASSANEVLINVWDYDPKWKITVTENGKQLQVKQLDDVKDPLYLVCYEAYEYEYHYDDAVYYPAYTTDHIFSVTCSSADSDIEITVTDRFGRKYSSTFERPFDFSIDNYREYQR